MNYQQEFLDQVENDILVLIDLHYEEIALNQDKIKLNPDWEVYRALEDQGKLKVFTARDNGTLVGYFVVVVGVNMHYKDHTFAFNDVIYLHKDYRKGFAGIKLIKFAKKCLTEDGVSVLTINTKVHQPFDRVLERLGFKLIERVYSSYLQGDS
jgi:GNAT superfamily N-acetyltransferase|tara:strand:- start:1293 stop:1751 length:459 start_codon:yes stop_codon:yes gene_type:complete